MTTETRRRLTDEEALTIFESGEGFDVEHGVNTPLGDIWVAREARDRAEAELTAAVRAGRAAGLSWNQISVGLGVTRQGARQRYMSEAEQLAAKGKVKGGNKSVTDARGVKHVDH